MVEGDGNDGAFVRTCVVDIGEGLQAQLRMSEIVHPDGRGGFEPDLSLPASAGRDTLVKAALGWLLRREHASSRASRCQLSPSRHPSALMPRRTTRRSSIVCSQHSGFGRHPLFLSLEGIDR